MTAPIRVCAHCQRLFSTTAPEQVFCSRIHRDVARQRRRDFEVRFRGMCPSPRKRRFRHPLHAVTFVERRGWDGQHPYLCICSGWHLTSKVSKRWHKEPKGRKLSSTRS